MDVILDSNVYVNDFAMTGTRFASLFDYLRKVDSALVVPRIVYDEVTARFVERLNNDTETLSKAVESYNRTFFTSRAEFSTPDVKKELDILQNKLSGQSEKVKTIFLDNYSQIDLAEVVRRGVHRIRPASSKGEELRDVILWLSVREYVRSGGSDVAFISDDRAFADPDGHLYSELRTEIAKDKRKLLFFRTLQDFIKSNALIAKDIDESLALRIAPEKEVQALVEQKLRSQTWTYEIKDVVQRDIEFQRGAEYETGPSSTFVELAFVLTMTLETEASPWLIQGWQNFDFVLTQPAVPSSQVVILESKTSPAAERDISAHFHTNKVARRATWLAIIQPCLLRKRRVPHAPRLRGRGAPQNC
jgi:hypothetical protein